MIEPKGNDVFREMRNQCEWFDANDEFEEDARLTGCGHKFESLMDAFYGDFDYCPACGKKIKEAE